MVCPKPARMPLLEWIWKQILLPRITYGCHVWGHTLTQLQKYIIKSAERLTLHYYAPMWKTTPTASLQVILNQKPSHIEIKGVGIKTYIRIKDQFQNNFWDGIPYDRRANSHLNKLKSITHEIIHEGNPLDDFVSDYKREPFYNWNPPTRNTLVAVCKNDIDDQNKIDDQFDVDDFDHDVDQQQQQHNVTALLPAKGHFQEPGDRHQPDNENTVQSVEGHFQVHGTKQRHNKNTSIHASEGHLQLYGNTSHNITDAALVPAGVHSKVQCNISQQSIPQGIPNITELTLDLFDNNYHLFAKKISCLEDGLFIRVILFKKKKLFLTSLTKL